jgi:fibronectin-binding autotransporter adhesin
MGQLPSSAFQAYDPSNASSIEPGPFALYSVSVDQILPTQMNEGFAEVDSKISGWNLVAPSDLQSTLLTDIEPVVVGPDGKLYLLNGHHTFTSLMESNYGASNPTVYVNIVANYSNLTESQFWTQMQAGNLVLPLNDGVPQTLNTNTGSPIPTSLTGLTDDPYRGLEHSILKNKSSVLYPNSSNITGATGASTPGLDKMNGFYADFIWAEAYRNANGGLGLSYLSPGDVAQSTQWNLNPNSTTTMPGISGTVTVAQLPGFILSQDITISTTISNATLANGTLDGNGTFTGHTSFTFGSTTLGTVQSGFVMQLGADAGHTVTLSGANTYTGGTTILAGTLIVANDAALGAAAPASYSIDLNNITSSVEAANGIIFNSLSEGASTLKLGTTSGAGTSTFTTNRPIAVNGETATINFNGYITTLTGTIISVGSNGSGIGAATGVSDLRVADTSTGSKGVLVLAPTSGSNANFYGNWIISSGTLRVSSDAALGNTTGPSYEIGQIDLDGGTFQAGASFASVRSLFLTGGSTYDTNGFTTSFSGSMSDTQRTLKVINSSTTSAGAVTFGSFNVAATASLALSGGTAGETVTFTNGITRAGNATVLIQPSSTTSLGGTEKVKSGVTPTLTNGIVSAWMITDNGGSASSNPYDFLTYGSNGYVKATYTKTGSGSSGGIRVATSTDTVEQTGNASLAANAQAYALKVDSGATITATGFTLTLGDGTDPAGLILSNGIISGGTLAFGGSEALIYAKGSSVAISSTITGSNGLTLSGSGTLTLSAASTLTGLISIDSGTLSLTAANVFANDVSGVNLLNVKSSPSNAVLNFTANQTFTTLNSSGNNSAITFSNGAQLTIGDTTNNLDSTLSSAITESGSAVSGALTKAGSGLLDLSGMSKGKLTLVAGSSIAVTGGTLRLAANEFANSTNIALSSGTEVQFAENGGDVYAGNLTGSGDMRLFGGTLKLTGIGNTYAGGTFVEAGSTLDLTTANVSTGNANIGDSGGAVDFDQTTTGTYSGVISDAKEVGTGPLLQGTLIKDDSTGANSGNVTLSAVQTYTGFTYIEAGTLTLAAVDTLADSSGVVLGRVGGGATATLVLNNNNMLMALSDDASNTTSVQLNGHVLTLDPSTTISSLFAGIISDGSGVGSIIKTGAGTVTFSGASTFTGGVDISAGTFELASLEAAGTGRITFESSSATLKIDLGTQSTNTIDGFSSGDVVDLASLTYATGGTATLGANNVLHVAVGGATYDLKLDPNQNFSGDVFHLTADNGSGTDVTVTPPPVQVVSAGVTSSGLVITNGTTLQVLSGGVADATRLTSGGRETVSGGGIDSGATVSSGGLLTVSAGGTASGTVLNNAGEIDAGSAVSASELAGSWMAVASGGGASGTAVSNSVLFVSGTASGTQLNTGTEIVSSGGMDFGATASAGSELIVSAGGTASGTVVSSAGELDAGRAVSTSLLGGSWMAVASGGGASGTTVSKSVLFVSGTASGTQLNTGTEIVSFGGMDFGATVSTGSELIVSAGGTASGTVVSNAGEIDAGSAVSTSLLGGSWMAVASGGVASGTTVSNSVLFVSGTAGGTQLKTGTEVVSSGGTDFGATVSAGSTLIVSAGGIASGTVVSSAGELDAGSAVSTTLLGGSWMSVASGGVASGTTVSNSVLFVSGTASGTQINSGGTEVVSSGGVEVGAQINSGGVLEVASGGSTGSGAVMFAVSGGGRLRLDDSVHFGGLVAGFGQSDLIDLRDIAFTSATMLSWTQLTSGATASGTLTVSGGGSVANIELLGQYAVGQFTSASDGHGGIVVGATTDTQSSTLAIAHGA